MEQRKIILDAEAIRRKIERIAWQIYEDHDQEKHIILAGIRDRGNVVAGRIKKVLDRISPLKVDLIEVLIDRNNPLDAGLSRNMDFTGKVVILTDDVTNSGRTLLFALKPFLHGVPRIIRTAVLIDRQHKSFPIVPDYSGYSLATTLQDNILVEMEGENILLACLE
ncbi:MAG TPA: phosphoribosyltransferase family protein [Chitinophagaceae bacterium]|nr:phosphoribosyltransferase family protein [Chitinophagaceae bacterium]